MNNDIQNQEQLTNPEQVVNVEPVVNQESLNVQIPVQDNHSNDVTVKNESTKKSGVVKLIFIVAVIGTILFGGTGLYMAISASQLTDDPSVNSFFGLVLGLPFLIISGFYVLFLWIIYALSRVVSKKYEQADSKGKKIILIIVIILVGAIYVKDKLGPIIEDKVGYQLYGISYYIDNVPTYNDGGYYFLKNDKVYIYQKEKTGKKIKYNFYSSDIDGKNLKLITTNSIFKDSTFIFSYGDEAYFKKDKSNFKVNLNSGEIKELNNNFNYEPLLYNDGKIYALGGELEDSTGVVRIIDLNNDSVIYEGVNEYSEFSGENYYDFNTNNYYEITPLSKDTNQYFRIEKNGELIDTILLDNEYIKDSKLSDMAMLCEKDDNVYVTTANYIIKYNVNSRQIEKAVKFNISRYKRILTNDFTNDYFYMNGSIYIFNYDSMELEKLFEVPLSEDGEKIEAFNFEYKMYINDKEIILPIGADSDRARLHDRTGNVLIYNKQSKELKKYEKVRRASFDYENKILYIVIKNGRKYKIEKYGL